MYGLAANAFSEEAVAGIFAVKGRPSNNPLIVHVSSVKMARDCISAWPEEANILAEKFWPGPLSMVLPMSEKISNFVNTLPESLKTAFTLRESEGKSYEEISVITETPIGTVRSRIFRARASIIDYMKKEIINNE